MFVFVVEVESVEKVQMMVEQRRVSVGECDNEDVSVGAGASGAATTEQPLPELRPNQLVSMLKRLI